MLYFSCNFFFTTDFGDGSWCSSQLHLFDEDNPPIVNTTICHELSSSWFTFSIIFQYIGKIVWAWIDFSTKIAFFNHCQPKISFQPGYAYSNSCPYLAKNTKIFLFCENSFFDRNFFTKMMMDRFGQNLLPKLDHANSTTNNRLSMALFGI